MSKEIEPEKSYWLEVPTDINNVVYQKTPAGFFGSIINAVDLLFETATSDSFNLEPEPKVAVRESEASSYNGFNIAAEDLTGVGEDIILGG